MSEIDVGEDGWMLGVPPVQHAVSALQALASNGEMTPGLREHASEAELEAAELAYTHAIEIVLLAHGIQLQVPEPDPEPETIWETEELPHEPPF